MKLIQQPGIDIKTFKSILSVFQQCLSKHEKERWSFTIALIKQINDKQESLINTNEIKIIKSKSDLKELE